MHSEYGMFTEEQVKAMADRGDTVYQHEFATRFEPYSAQQVSECVDKLLHLMKASKDVQADVAKDQCLVDFADKYQVFYKNLTDKDFIANPKNIETVRKLVHLKARLDEGTLSEDAAKSQCSSIALETTWKGSRHDSGSTHRGQ